MSDDCREYTISDHSIDFQINTFSEYLRFRNLVGEEPILKDVLDSIEDGDSFYDVGANVGTYTCFMASRLNNGKVVAFEPEPKNAEQLRENLRQNDLEAQIFEVALSDTNGNAELALMGEEPGEGKHSISTEEPRKTITVETSRGDSIIQRHNISKPTVMKIDVEGAEMSVLRGMESVLEKNCRLMYIEVHSRMDESGLTNEDKVRSFLVERDFEVEILAERDEEKFIRAQR